MSLTFGRPKKGSGLALTPKIPILSCRFCAWKALPFYQTPDGAPVTGLQLLYEHISQEHPVPFRKFIQPVPVLLNRKTPNL